MEVPKQRVRGPGVSVGRNEASSPQELELRLSRKCVVQGLSLVSSLTHGRGAGYVTEQNLTL